MTTIRRDKASSSESLVQAIDQFVVLLRDEREDEAIADLLEAKRLLRAKTDPANQEKAIRLVIDAFEGEHELMAYTIQRADSTGWTRADELSQASARVITLARRIT